MRDLNTGSCAFKLQEMWSISDAVLIGVSSLVTLSFLQYFSSSLIEHGFALRFNRFQARELTTLIAQVGTGLVLAPVVLSISQRRRLGGWWASIEWNSTKQGIAPSIACGAILAILVSMGLKAIYGTAGSLRGPVNVVLYVLSEVFVGSLMEEMYFRGVLFLALAKKFGTLASIVIVTFISSLVHLGPHVLRIAGDGRARVHPGQDKVCSDLFRFARFLQLVSGRLSISVATVSEAAIYDDPDSGPTNSETVNVI